MIRIEDNSSTWAIDENCIIWIQATYAYRQIEVNVGDNTLILEFDGLPDHNYDEARESLIKGLEEGQY